ncbi:DNA-processing protein DprA [Fructobacillus parabroussonetiae]|uniref:DNA-processing protein DprA n=1 Tax=Fructobacillus parabroussonetiae TaxID=2713174 RepID=UPI00308423F0
MKKRQFMLALHLTKGIGRAREAVIIQRIEAKQAPESFPWSVTALAFVLGSEMDSAFFANLASAYQEALKQAPQYQENYLTYFDDDYPERLRQIYQPPLVFFYKGDRRALTLPALAVVGTRTATPYGLEVIRQFIPELVNQGIAIVSGLAKGIDVMAHQATFAAGGRTNCRHWVRYRSDLSKAASILTRRSWPTGPFDF